MRQIRASRPSPAIIVAILALVAALAGSAIAGPHANTSAVTKSKLKKIATKQADKQIDERAPGLSVANANALEGKPASAFASSESEPYHEVGSPGEPGFQNGWANVDSGFSTAAFYKDPLGVVHLKGDIDNATDDNTAAFTLPPGYRPSQSLFLPAAAGVVAFLIIEPDGVLAAKCVGPGFCELGIDGLTFRAP